MFQETSWTMTCINEWWCNEMMTQQWTCCYAKGVINEMGGILYEIHCMLYAEIKSCISVYTSIDSLYNWILRQSCGAKISNNKNI
jgi:hypothetical protein